jgi:hypothetical protein
MAIKLTFGKDYDVFESGTIIQFNQESFLFELIGSVDTGSSIKVEFRFSLNAESLDSKMNFEDGGLNHLILNLINFNNKIGQGNVEPLNIGTLDNRELFLSFRVTSGNEIFARTLDYTFYLGKVVNNG